MRLNRTRCVVRLSRRRTRSLLAGAAAIACAASLAPAQTTNYFSDTGGSLAGNTWSTNPAGPYNAAFDATGGGHAVFDNATSFTGASVTFAGITVSADITLTGTGGTISSYNDGIMSIDVASGVVADFGTQTWTAVNTAGFTKSGDGTLAWAGGGFGGGFTLNAGTVIARGDNALGGGASNFLVINGGTIAANSTRNFSGKFTNGITIAGNFQLGSSTGLALASANLTFNNAVNLAGGTRTFTLGGTGVYTFSGAVTNGGIIVQSADGVSGTLALSNTSGTSTYAGSTIIRSGTLRIDSQNNLTSSVSSAGTGTIYVGDASLTLTGSTAKLTYTNGQSRMVNNAIVVQGAATNIIGSAHTTNTLTYAGGITMNAPLTLMNEGNGGLVFSTNAIVGNGHALNLYTQGTASLTINSSLTGTGLMTVSVASSTSTVTLNAANTGFTGDISLQAGTLGAGLDSSLGNGEITMANGTRLNLNNAFSSGGRDYTLSKIYIPTGTATLNFTTTTGRLNRVASIDLGTAGVGGTLQVTSTGNAGQSLVTGLVRIFGDSTFYIGQSPNGTLQVYDNAVGITSVGGDYGITKTGPGTMFMGYSLLEAAPIPAIAGVASTYGGGTTIAQGVMRLGMDNALPTQTTVAIAGGALLDMSTSFNFPHPTVLVSQEIAGLNNSGDGGGVVHGNSTNTSSTVNRVLTLSGSGSYSFAGGILNKLGTNTTPNNTVTLVKSGSGTQVLSGANSWTGGTSLQGGVLEIGPGADATVQNLTPQGLAASPTAGASAGATTLSFANAQANGIYVGMPVMGAVPAGTTVAAISGDSVTFSGGVTGTITTASVFNFGQMNRATVASTAGLAVGQGISAGGFATGTIITGIAGNTLILSANNASGNLGAVSGTFAAWDSLPTSGSVTLSGGTLRWGAGNTEDYSARFATAAGQQYKLDTGGNSVTVSTALNSSGGSLAKLGAGVLTLAADNQYDGPTTVAGGTLRLGASERILNTGAVILAGGTFDTGGFDETLGEVHLTGNSTLDMGSGSSHIAFNAVGTFDTTKSLQILNWNGDLDGFGTDQVYITESNTLTQLQLASIQFVNPAGFSGTYGATQLESGELVAAVPEPGTLGLLSLGGIGLLRRRRLATGGRPRR